VEVGKFKEAVGEESVEREWWEVKEGGRWRRL